MVQYEKNSCPLLANAAFVEASVHPDRSFGTCESLLRFLPCSSSSLYKPPVIKLFASCFMNSPLVHSSSPTCALQSSCRLDVHLSLLMQ